MKKYSLFAILLLLSATCMSQTVLMKEEVKDTLFSSYGPNLKNFYHFYVGFGFVTGKSESAGSDIINEKSTNFSLGFRYKYRLCNAFSLGYDIAYNTYGYALKQDRNKITPDTILHDKEKLRFGNVGLSGFMRFNYDKRGNRVGNFIDLGGYGDYTMYGSHFMRDERENGNIVHTTVSRLKYFNRWNYGMFARIGFNALVIYGNYRMSDLFKSSYEYPELPRLTVGVQIGFHK